MKPEIKQLWVDALRSGHYNQVCGIMRDGKMTSDEERNKYPNLDIVPDMDPKSKNMCVMGVLADVALTGSGLKPTVTNWLKFADSNEYPSKRTLEWAGLEKEVVDEMIGKNDAAVMTFQKFADYIEKNF